MATFKMDEVRHQAEELQKVSVEHFESRFGRNIALLIALVMLFTAIVTYMEATAASEEARMHRDGQAAALAGMAALSYADQRMFHEGNILLRYQAIADQRTAEQGLAQWYQSHGDDKLATTYATSAARLGELSQRVARFGILLGGDSREVLYQAVERDSYLNAYQLLATERVKADAAEAYRQKADTYVSIITIMAVTLFLYGLSLTLHGRIKYLFVGIGSSAAVACLAWVVVVASATTPEIPAPAIEQYASGQVYSDQGRYKEAIHDLKEALAQAPAYADAYALLGYCQLSKAQDSSEELAESATNLSRSIELGRDRAWNWSYLSRAYYRIGKYEEAVQASERALRLNPESLESRLGHASALLALGKTEQANEAYAQAIAEALGEEMAPVTVEEAFKEAIADLEFLTESKPQLRQRAELDLILLKEVFASWQLFHDDPAKRDLPLWHTFGHGASGQALAAWNHFREDVLARSGVAVGPIVFAQGADEQDRPVNMTASFPAATKEVYAFFDYVGMSDGLPWMAKWYRDGQEFSVEAQRWSGGSSGTLWIGIAQEPSLPPGHYRLDLYWMGLLVRSDTFTIGESGH